jgi:DNA-binding ferritin-like protein (Dps family)
MFISKLISKVIGPKRQWWRYKARVKQLPPSYRTAVEAIERYLMYAGLVDDPTAMFEDLIELFEQSAARGTPVHEVVGDDPVEFVEAFVRNYGDGWRIREQERLKSDIERAAKEDTRKGGTPR